MADWNRKHSFLKLLFTVQSHVVPDVTLNFSGGTAGSTDSIQAEPLAQEAQIIGDSVEAWPLAQEAEIQFAFPLPQAPGRRLVCSFLEWGPSGVPPLFLKVIFLVQVVWSRLPGLVGEGV